MSGEFQPDRGWAWVVGVSSILCNVISDGIGYVFGVIYPELLMHFGQGRAMTSWIGSVGISLELFAGLAASILVNKFGCKMVTITGGLIATSGYLLSMLSPNIYTMILTYGVLGGIGLGFVQFTPAVMIGYYFRKHRALAMGLAASGSGLGTFIFAPLVAFLIDLYAWKGAVIIIAGIALQGAVCGMLFRPILESSNTGTDPQNSNKESDTQSAKQRKKPLLKFILLKDPVFLVYCLSNFCCLMGVYIPTTYIVDYILRRRIADRQTAAITLSIYGIGNTISRPILGWICDKPWADSLVIYIIALTIGGAATATVTWMDSFILLCIYSAVYSIAIAVYASQNVIILIDLMGLDNLSDAYGFLNMVRGIAPLIGPPLAGFLYDTTGEYSLGFYVAGGAIAMSGLLGLPLRKLRSKNRTTN